MREKLQPVFWILRRELIDQLRDWRILFPLIVLSFFFPISMTGIAESIVGFISRYGAELVIQQLVPFTILAVGFFPSTIALTIALESIVGERERNTIEPLLATPLENWQLYLGKLLSGTVAPVMAVLFALSFYLFLVHRRDVPLPSPGLIAMLYLISVANTLMMISGATFISAQSTTIRSATLSSSFVLLPASFLVMAEANFLFWKDLLPLFWIVMAVLLVTVAFLRLGLVYFERENLLGREIDTLNFRRYVRLFWRAFRGEARSVWEWYRYEVRRDLQQLRPALLIFLALFPVSLGLGVYVADTVIKPALETAAPPSIQTEGSSREELYQTLRRILPLSVSGSEEAPAIPLSMGFIFRHNLTSTIFVFFMGLVSLGTMGAFAYLLNIGLLGIVWRGLEWAQLSPLKLYLFGVAPHGIFEIPSMILSFATVFYMGVRLITPSGKPISTILIENLALWARLMVALIIPLLLIAAAVESSLTVFLLKAYLLSIK
jgi:uncharacterized membrane protein SpoIIM required for sporulation